jgi:glutamyl-tRNA synthetase
MKPVRTRIAPSPTGDPHVGTAYVALFNRVFAHQHGGQFILRIEDTDQVRSTPESEQRILEALQWMGLTWDEGPGAGGDHGPWRQSERGDIYRRFAEQLVADGHAFYCFATSEELDALRQHQLANKLPLGYDGRGLQLSGDEVQARLARGEPHVIRMKVPTSGVCRIQDRLRGAIEIDWSQVDMQVLLKADGWPTYHLANVVDDHLMGITHVIRGEEWISSAPKHQLLYQYFGWDMPELIHLPLLRNPDKSKLSKRRNPTSILYYRDLGILPETLVNYLGRMGWSMPDEQEKFSLDDMVEAFDIQRISLGGPVFDVDKLTWLNGLWIREMTPDQFLERYINWARQRLDARALSEQIHARTGLLSDVMPSVGFMYQGDLGLDGAAFAQVKLEPDQLLSVLQFGLWRLEGQTCWERDALFQAMKHLADAMGIGIRNFLQPFFIAITGRTSAFSVIDAMYLLGPDMTRMRLRQAIECLGAPGKKRIKSMEKAFQALQMP